MDQKLSPQIGGDAGIFQFLGQIKVPEEIWTLSLLPRENWKSLEFKGRREFYNLSNEG
jgi:hypothetical protein